MQRIRHHYKQAYYISGSMGGSLDRCYCYSAGNQSLVARAILRPGSPSLSPTTLRHSRKVRVYALFSAQLHATAHAADTPGSPRQPCLHAGRTQHFLQHSPLTYAPSERNGQGERRSSRRSNSRAAATTNSVAALHCALASLSGAQPRHSGTSWNFWTCRQ